MTRNWELIGQYNSETTADTPLAGTPASPWNPGENARLLAIRTVVCDEAATSLVNVGVITLTSKIWGHTLEVPFIGTGLRTVPAMVQPPIDSPIDMRVQAGVPVVLKGRHLTADTPITCNVLVWALLES